MCPPLDWMLGLKRKAKTPSPPHRTCILSEAADTKWTAAVPHDENHDGKRWGHRGKAHDPALGGGGAREWGGLRSRKTSQWSEHGLSFEE